MPKDLITMELEIAFKQAGCPICTLIHKTEQRSLFNFLWENVNDGPIRVQLIRSLGFCHKHAWQLVAMEWQAWGGGLGTGIVYEDLGQHVQEGLKEYVAVTRERLGQRPRGWWLALRTRLGEAMWRWARQFGWGHFFGSEERPPLPLGLEPQQECRLCRHTRETEETHLRWLLMNCDDEAFRAAYQASAGLCLPHLRKAMIMDEDGEATLFLAQTAQEKLGVLLGDLGEYLRKFNYQYSHEPKTAAEKASWRRMVAFLVGEGEETAG